MRIVVLVLAGWLMMSGLWAQTQAQQDEPDADPAVIAAREQLEQVRAHYQANALAEMAAAAQAGLDALGPDTDAAKLRGSLWYWAAVSQEMLGDFDAALERYQRAMAVHEAAGNRREVAATLNSLANLHGMRGEQKPRLEALVRSRDIFGELGEARGQAAVANSLGNYYAEVQQFEEAHAYFEQSVALRREMGNPGYLAAGLQGLGVNFRDKGDSEQARQVLEEALAIYRELEDPGGLAGVLTNLGNIARVDQRFDHALSAYTEALGYDRATGYRYGEAILTHNLALTHHEMGDPAAALEWADQAIELAEALGNPERREHAYKTRSEVREALVDAAGSLADLRRMTAIREERVTAAREEELLAMQARFETAEKQREIEQLERAAIERELALTREESARQAAEQAQLVEQARGRTTRVLAVGAGVVAVVLAGLFRWSRRSERRLARQQKETEEAVAGLRAAHAELKKLYDRKSEFLGFAVHDLRSPLFAIDAVCGEIEQGLLDEPAEGAKEIRLAAERMRTEIDAWLAAEREEQTELQVHPVAADLGQLAADVVALNRPGARAKDQSLELSTEGGGEAIAVRVDPWRWSEVLDNLVSNAVKFTPKGGSVSVSVRAIDGRGEVQVRDTGPGLSAEDKEQVFGSYARLSAQPTGGENSTGLGLHLVKRLVDAHGGEIAVEDAPDGGAVFVVSVPLDS
jgi:signal transduction histidine kinase